MDPRSSTALVQDPKQETWKQTLLLAFQSLGVVYGHLSISPLYVFETVGVHNIRTEESLYGLLSFMFWTMTIIPLIKYVFIVLGADDNGEGGVFALYLLLCKHAKVGLLPNQLADDVLLTYEMESVPKTKVESKARRAIEKHKSSHYLLLLLALLGFCMVIADGVLTPAMSDVPLTSACDILIGLFALQHYGTHKIGFIFAPIISLWLLFISSVGVYNIFHWNSHDFCSLSPGYMYRFLKDGDINRWKSLGGVLLCIAGVLLWWLLMLLHYDFTDK